MKKVVTYTYPGDDVLVRKARFTLQTLTVGDLGKYSQLSLMYQKHVEQTLGGPWSKLTEEQREAADPEIMAKSRLWQKWAYIKPTIRRVEVSEDGDRWEDGDLGTLGYDDLKGLDGLPLDLLNALDTTALQVTPGVFGMDDMDPLANKSIVIE